MDEIRYQSLLLSVSIAGKSYEIIEWNEDNFDVNIIPYTKEAYEAKKYAFVSDYARFCKEQIGADSFESY